MIRLCTRGLIKNRICKAAYFYKKSINPTRVVIFGFLIVILFGAALLTLPFSSKSGQATGFLTALFTATSSTCVTGLVLVDTYQYWSPFGQFVILLLIQCGGLGFMTLATIFSFLLRRTITLRERLIMTQSLNIEGISGIVRLTRHILLGTLFAELSGALILSIRFAGEFGWCDGIVKGIFHSVSAFCNAGFDLMGQKGAFTGLTTYVSDPIVNITVMSLVIVGGLGFFVWEDIYRKRSFRKLSLHSKLVISITSILLIGGALFFLIFEFNNPETMRNLPFGSKLLASFFQSTTTRTAGYNTISQIGLTQPSKIMSILLMFIGGSPGSTAGGIKTVTFGILFLTAYSVIRGKPDITAFERRISFRAVLSALAITMVALCLLSGAVLILLLFQNQPIIDLIFEAVSAFGTVGLSANLTPLLHPISQIIIICLMFFGRVGILTISVGLLMRNSDRAKIHYPEGKILVG